MTIAAVGGLYRHKKTGNNYVVTGFCMIESSWTRGVLYSKFPSDGSLPIMRPESEFEDGRFEPLVSGPITTVEELEEALNLPKGSIDENNCQG